VDESRYELVVARRMVEVGRDEWDALLEPMDRPLLSWGFLALLEESGSIGPEAGWKPAHFLLRRKEEGDGPVVRGAGRGGAAKGRLVAAAPFYLRSGSWGDFVFDFDFAEAAEGMGAPYYPKLVGAVPVTPAPAWRVLVAADEDRPALETLVLEAAIGAARSSGLAGIQLSWPEVGFAQRVTERRAGTREGTWLPWEHQAFLWTDEGYGDFAGLLGAFSKNMRRNAKREREAVRDSGVETRMIGPAEAGPALLARMAGLYESHNDKFGPWAARFLTGDFFLRLPEFMPEGWTIATALGRSGTALGRGGAAQGEALALAFLLEGPERLYGRFWGSESEIEGLHFELCYYLPLEYALARGIRSFDPGMGSPHKARRGFRSYAASSLHLPFDPRVRALMEAYLPSLGEEARREIEALNAELPYKARAGAGEPEAGSSTL